MKIAVFPGSFDPITIGHVDLVKRAAPLFDKIIVAIGINANKKYMASLEQRLAWIDETFKDLATVETSSFKGLTVDYCKEVNATHLLRGLRNSADLEFEKAIAQANYKLNSEVESIFLLTSPEHSFISSSIVRDVARNNGNYHQFVPKVVRF